MEDFIEIQAQIKIIKDLAQRLIRNNTSELKEGALSTKDYELIELIDFANYSLNSKELEDLPRNAIKVCNKAALVFNNLSNKEGISEEEENILETIIKQAIDLRDLSEGTEKKYRRSAHEIESVSFEIKELNKILEELKLEIQSTKSSFVEIKSEMESTVTNTKEKYTETINNLQQQDKQVTDLVKLIAKKGISGDFESSAVREQKAADIFRALSIILMITMIGITAYTLHESTGSDFNWENSIFRMSFAFLMLIPATYLAKESAKHREQQHFHHEKSLILKAIDPYINNLPDQEKHAIKYEIANRIFSVNNTRINANDSTVQISSIIESIAKALKRTDEK